LYENETGFSESSTSLLLRRKETDSTSRVGEGETCNPDRALGGKKKEVSNEKKQSGRTISTRWGKKMIEKEKRTLP